MSTYIVIGLLVLGLLVGRLIKSQRFTHKASEQIAMITIYLLLFLLGISVGINPEIINNLPVIGFHAIFLSVGALLGTLVLSYLVVRLFFKDQ